MHTINLQQIQQKALEQARSLTKQELLRGVRTLSNDEPTSFYRYVAEAAEQQDALRRRRPNSIHGSSYWNECAREFICEVLGLTPTNRQFNLSNWLAADAGDEVHTKLQKLVDRLGFPVQLPYYTDTPIEEDYTDYWRQGETISAVEVPLWDYYNLPQDKDILDAYEAKGFNREALETFPAHLELLKLIYRLGIRIDLVAQRPGKPPMICEIKSVKEKYFLELEKMTDEEITKIVNAPPDKKTRNLSYQLRKFILQLQMQMYWWFDPATGKRSSMGMLAIVNRNDEDKLREIYVPFNAAIPEAYLPLIRFKAEIWEYIEANPGKTVDEYMAGLGIEETPGEDCSFCDYWSLCQHPEKQKHLGNIVVWSANRAKNKDRRADEQSAFESLAS